VLAARTRALREFATVSERRLWEGLSSGKAGVSFRRQVVIAGRYIVDFYASEQRLVVEVEGSIHALTRRADARREERLRRLGYHVLRLDAELVMRDSQGAVAHVRAEVERLRP
jgi:type I restriction enzyme R subunit